MHRSSYRNLDTRSSNQLDFRQAAYPASVVPDLEQHASSIASLLRQSLRLDPALQCNSAERKAASAGHGEVAGVGVPRQAVLTQALLAKLSSATDGCWINGTHQLSVTDTVVQPVSTLIDRLDPLRSFSVTQRVDLSHSTWTAPPFHLQLDMHDRTGAESTGKRCHPPRLPKGIYHAFGNSQTPFALMLSSSSSLSTFSHSGVHVG